MRVPPPLTCAFFWALSLCQKQMTISALSHRTVHDMNLEICTYFILKNSQDLHGSCHGRLHEKIQGQRERQGLSFQGCYFNQILAFFLLHSHIIFWSTFIPLFCETRTHRIRQDKKSGSKQQHVLNKWELNKDVSRILESQSHQVWKKPARSSSPVMHLSPVFPTKLCLLVHLNVS